MYLDDQDRKMIVTRAAGMRPLLLADCHVPPDLRFTFYDQVHTTGARMHHSGVYAWHDLSFVAVSTGAARRKHRNKTNR